MSNRETARELDRLRADIAALQEAKREAKPKAEPPPAEPPVAEAPAPVLPEEQKSQLEELGDLLQAEIEDLPTITTLAVFSLGLLMGRLLR